MKVIMIPCVEGGIGHISRTAILARALRRMDPSVEVEYVLDTVRLRPLNVEMTAQMGYRPRLLPPITRANRQQVTQECLGDADVIIDDTARYLLPLRAGVPRCAWISIPIHPVADELFGDWPLMKQMDAIIWAYPPLIEMPEELGLVADKVVRTGPFLDVAEVPERQAARRALGVAPDARIVLYAVRSFPFGREHGHKALASLYGAVEMLRRSAHPELQLHLLAVKERDDLRGVPGVPDELPGWVHVQGVVPQARALLHMRAADILLGEGTSTMHEGAALGTPLVLAPGPITETLLLARGFGESGAARSLDPASLGPDALAAAFQDVLGEPERTVEMARRAQALVTGGGGVEAAARLVLGIAARAAA